MSLLKKTQEICRQYNIKPQKSKGQNFLINEKIYSDIVNKAKIDGENVLEVGPGLGFLTAQLVNRAKFLVAVELDKNLYNFLQAINLTYDNEKLKVVNQDILKFNPADYFSPKDSYCIVSNLPYNISSIFLRTYLNSNFPPKKLFLMLQKEVAQRITGKEPKMNLLSFSVQYYAEVNLIKIIKADNFWPKPEVDSALIEINYKEKEKNKEFDKSLFRLAKIGFSAKRKMLKNNLSNSLKIDEGEIISIFKKCNIKEKARAQELSINDWLKLANYIN